MKHLKILVTLWFVHSQCFAGNLNIINLAPPGELKLEIKAGGKTEQFTLNSESSTGIFALPQKAAVLKIIDNKTPTQKLAAKPTGRIAVLHPKGKLLAWSVYDSKPTEGKTSLRLVNVTDEEAILIHKDQKITLKAKETLPLPEMTTTPFRVSFANGEKVAPYDQEEPSAVVGFIYRSEGSWKILYVNDI